MSLFILTLILLWICLTAYDIYNDRKIIKSLKKFNKDQELDITTVDTEATPYWAYESDASAMDVRAMNIGLHYDEYNNCVTSDFDKNGVFTLPPGHRVQVETGLQINKVSPGLYLSVTPRSGTALHKGITVLNSPGRVDGDYRGIISVILINHSKVDFTFNRKDRIAQMAIMRSVGLATKSFTEDENKTSRNAGGFGSSGNN